MVTPPFFERAAAFRAPQQILDTSKHSEAAPHYKLLSQTKLSGKLRR
jgi:hypothetical protein